MPRRPTGRPKLDIPDLTPKKVRKLAAVLSTRQMADYFGISPDTLERRLDEDDALMRAYKGGKAEAISQAGDKLLSLVRKGNLSAIIFYLKTQAGWRETLRLDASVFDPRDLTDAQLEQIEAGVPIEKVLASTRPKGNAQ